MEVWDVYFISVSSHLWIESLSDLEIKFLILIKSSSSDRKNADISNRKSLMMYQHRKEQTDESN
jgi:hypothetical protein